MPKGQRFVDLSAVARSIFSGKSAVQRMQRRFFPEDSAVQRMQRRFFLENRPCNECIADFFPRAQLCRQCKGDFFPQARPCIGCIEDSASPFSHYTDCIDLPARLNGHLVSCNADFSRKIGRASAASGSCRRAKSPTSLLRLSHDGQKHDASSVTPFKAEPGRATSAASRILRQNFAAAALLRRFSRKKEPSRKCNADFAAAKRRCIDADLGAGHLRGVAAGDAAPAAHGNPPAVSIPWPKGPPQHSPGHRPG